MPIESASEQNAMPTPLREQFEVLADLAPHLRDAWLAANVDDGDTRALLLRLLGADTSDGFLDVSAVQRLACLVAVEIAPQGLIGERVGAFRIVRELGRGGMAVVFLGARVDADFEQQVAIKLLRRGLYSELETRLFLRERQVLATLSHPNIARLIDGGVTSAGIPYLVMEYVDGVPITQYVTAQQLDLRARLSLFLAVCRAVEAAHRGMVVHRDIKPSNILVTASGEVKLLDFGIAKLIEEEGTDATAGVFTADYAAPEQLSGDAITTATDVYGLGVLLHELLLGLLPAGSPTRRPSSRVNETEQTAKATFKMTPAGALTSLARARLGKLLRGDLDNIVLHALNQDPARRYGSAAAFADDIERYLVGQPVNAHPPSSWYSARKFIGRHRGGVATSALFLLAIIAALGLALWQAQVAHQQTRLAQEQALRAQAVRDLLVGIFDAEIPSGPRSDLPTTAELLERGAQRARHDLAATPAVQSDLLIALGRVYDHLSMPDKGRPLLDAAVAAARRVEPIDQTLLAAALSERGAIDLASDAFAPALVFLNQAIALQQQADPRGLTLALTLDRRALAESQMGQHAQAIADYRAALEIRQKKLPPDHPEILHSLSALGNAMNREGNPQQATEFLRRALFGARSRFGENHVKTAHYTKNYAINQGMLRHYDVAAELTERSVRIEQNLYPEGSPDIVNGLNNLGSFNLALGRLNAARETLKQAAKLNRDGGQGDSLGQTFVLGNLARAHELLGNREQALDTLSEAERIATKVVGIDHARTVTLKLQRTRLEFLADSSTAAVLLNLTEQILRNPEKLAQFRPRSESEARLSLGLAQAALNQPVQAGDSLKRAVSELPSDRVDPLLLPAVIALAEWQRANGEQAAAEALLRKMIERTALEFSAAHYALGLLHLTLAEGLASSRPDEAIKHAQAAQAGFAELPEKHPWRERAAGLLEHIDANGRAANAPVKS